MSVASSTNMLEASLAAYRRDRDQILTNGLFSQAGKLERLATLVRERAASAEQVAVRLWGGIQPVAPPPVDPPGTIWRRTLVVNQIMDSVLDPAGEAWTEIAAAATSLASAREAAERAGVSPEWLALHQARISAMLRQALGDPQPWKAFEAAYDGAAAETKLAVQNFAAAMLPHGREWNLLALRLERDRDVRVNTPAVQAAEQAGAALVDLLVERAVPVTQQLSAELGQASLYLERAPKGIQVKRTPAKVDGASFASAIGDRPLWKITVERVEFRANAVSWP